MRQRWTLGTEDGGADNLPFRGLGPYTPVDVGTMEKATPVPVASHSRFPVPRARRNARDDALTLCVVEEAQGSENLAGVFYGFRWIRHCSW